MKKLQHHKVFSILTVLKILTNVEYDGVKWSTKRRKEIHID